VTTSAIPALIDALVSAARTALPGVAVYDGYGVSDDPGDFLMVGVEDVNSLSDASAADSQQEWAGVGSSAPRDETGDVICTALSWNGNGDQKAARDGAFAIAEAVATLLRANPSLGIPSLLWTSYGTTTQLNQNQDENGAEAAVIFRCHFRARL
jgi:hypothetical protein